MKVSHSLKAKIHIILWLAALICLSLCLFDIFTTPEPFASWRRADDMLAFGWRVLVAINLIVFLTIDYLRRVYQLRWSSFWLGVVMSCVVFMGAIFILIIPLSVILIDIGIKEDIGDKPYMLLFVLLLYEIFCFYGGVRRMANPAWVPAMFSGLSRNE